MCETPWGQKECDTFKELEKTTAGKQEGESNSLKEPNHANTWSWKPCYYK